MTGDNAHDAAAPGRGVLVSFDDTDDAQGGCTTAVVLGVIAALRGLSLRGMPRLVRLNPNVPYKTRGNGAVCLDIGHAEGPQVVVGVWQGHPIHARPDGAPAVADESTVRAIVEAVEGGARPGAAPGVTIWESPPPAALYWQAVRSRLERPEIESALQDGVAVGGRGVVGAAAAAAWPGPAASYELLAYRSLERIRTPRQVEGDFAQLDAQGVTFHSHDLDEDVRACVPNTPCPVLCGLRGLDPEALVQKALPALEEARREPAAGWLLFATNQASGDHVTPVHHVGEAPEWGTIAVDATVRQTPVTARGGHVQVELDDPRGRGFTAIAFEPTKSFRDVVRGLYPGDRIHVVGAFDGTLRLEKLRIDQLVAPQVKTENPVCPQCRRRMKSRGRDAGYRCPDGHGSAPEDAATRHVEPRSVRPGWHEVPVITRRHLHRPVLFDAMVHSSG